MLANSLKELRASRGMSQAELAEKLGVRQQTVGKWESSVTVPRQPMLQKLADIFGVTTDYLLGRTAEPAKHATSLSEDAVNDIFDDEDLRALARDRLEGATPAEIANNKKRLKRMIEVMFDAEDND